MISIASFLESENSDINVEFSVDDHDYVLNTLEEIKEFNQENIENTNNIRFYSKNEKASISITLDCHRAYLSVHKGTTYAIGIAEKIKKLLKQKQKPFGKTLRNTMLQPLALFVYLSIYQGIYGTSKIPINGNSVLVFILLCVWWFGSLRLSTSEYSTIYFASKKDHSNFLKNKKDDIILIIISASVGSLITYIFS